MEPWIIDASRDPDIALRIRQTGREIASIGGYLWDMIGRPEPFDVGAHAVRLNGEPLATYQFGAAADVIFSAAYRLRAGGGDDVVFQTGWSVAIHGEAGDDFIAGWADSALMTGGAGDDTLLGGAGQDSLVGGGGSNLLHGGDDADWLFTSSDRAWQGDETADAAWIAAKRASQDALYGGNGNDYLTSSYGADRLYGGDGDDWLRGHDGDDLLDGGFGNDTLIGDNGADTLRAGGGQDLLYGGHGDDVLSATDAALGAARMYGGDGADTIEGGAGNDRAEGGAGNDAIRLGAGNDVAAAELDFGGGDDLIFGEAGDDRLSGGYGRDTLDGGAGDDRLYGGARDDVLTGGAGADRFVIHAVGGIDVIADFGAGDRLEIFANVNGLGLEEPSALVGRAFLGDGFAWIDLAGETSAAPDGDHGVVLTGVADAARLADIIATAVDIV